MDVARPSFHFWERRLLNTNLGPAQHRLHRHVMIDRRSGVGASLSGVVRGNDQASMRPRSVLDRTADCSDLGDHPNLRSTSTNVMAFAAVPFAWDQGQSVLLAVPGRSAGEGEWLDP